MLQRARRGQVPALSRAVRDAGYKVVLTGEGSDEILGGYPHFRRDMLLYDNGGQDPADGAGTAGGARARATRSRAACSCPTARPSRPRACNARSVSRPRGSRRPPAPSSSCADCMAPAPSRRNFPGRDAYRALLDSLDVPGRLAGRAPVHQSLYLWCKTVLRELHPRRARRPHGDGALGRGPRPVPRSPRRRARRRRCRCRRRSAA